VKRHVPGFAGAWSTRRRFPLKTALVASALALGLPACGTVQYRETMPRPPYCVVGGAETLEQSMDQYGETFTPHLEGGPMASTPDTRIVPESMAGETCVSLPSWIDERE
jgi:hypothetical protein